MNAAARKNIRKHLARDPALRPVLRSVELPYWQLGRDPYAALIEAIMSQQLSGKAAATIHRRFLDLFPRRYPDPKRLARMTPAQLRMAGVSRQKAGYVKNVATFALEFGLDRKHLNRLSDDEVIAHLTQIKGVGRWTVEMLLMFDLGRPDVLPVDDLGIQQAMQKLYRLRAKGKKLHARMTKNAEPWRPYRSHACMLLWKWKSAG
ncbi:MAG TPA: DNA-3-methyladenine glycosylase 2 family protein [Kiritimatiellia bacterium]|jgi:DNA-3-methyladenine glycosylase II